MEIEGGNFTLTNELNIGSRLIYKCPEGYYPHPALTRLCQLNSKWDPLPKTYLRQQCKLVECPDPHVLEQGTVLPAQEKYYVHNRTRYECYSGNNLRGSSTRVCKPNGKWSGKTPICSRDTGDHCADPGIPAGTTRLGNVFGIGDSVKYVCQENLFLMGSEKRVCQEGGQWTGIEPSCYYKYTYDTPLEVSEAFGGSIRQTLTSLDSSENSQEGRTIRITNNGTLNIYIAMDMSESITAEDFEKSKLIVKKLLTKISSFAVSPNYEIIFFSSEVNEVANIMDFFGNKKKSLQSIIEELDKFTTDERSGTNLDSAFYTILEQIALIKQETGENFKDHHHVLIFFTDGGYNMGGPPTENLQKIKNLVYMNPVGEFQISPRDEYLDVYIFALGAEPYDETLKPLAVGADGEHYFRLENLNNLDYTFDQIIDEEEVKGLCGLHREYNLDESSDSRQKMFPWLANIFIKTRKCLGSLVTPKFILTAAHCFEFDDQLKDISVQLGILENGAREVKNIILHKDYNVKGRENLGVSEFYDYDVALIELKDAITISTNIRPICIPCTKETSEALGFVGSNTCKQQEQRLLPPKNEELSFLTASALEKHVIAKLGDTRESCISHALQANGITTTNPKDAVTDNFICTGGRQPEIDHIACTGDSGGAVFKNYQHRTVQVALVSWGTTTMCSSGEVVDSVETSRDFHINLFRVVPFLKSILGNDDQDDYAPLEFVD
ncbi:complement factor B-like isoform X2 [Lampris incognitus]|nr:complement factor B-like isoform X2 [Lampris incognitus]XP_056140547.1 complement factor B-like isoform X2 [Lampris incognitus]